MSKRHLVYLVHSLWPHTAVKKHLWSSSPGTRPPGPVARELGPVQEHLTPKKAFKYVTKCNKAENHKISALGKLVTGSQLLEANNKFVQCTSSTSPIMNWVKDGIAHTIDQHLAIPGDPGQRPMKADIKPYQNHPTSPRLWELSPAWNTPTIQAFCISHPVGNKLQKPTDYTEQTLVFICCTCC